MVSTALDWLGGTTGGHVVITLILAALVLWAVNYDNPQGGATSEDIFHQDGPVAK